MSRIAIAAIAAATLLSAVPVALADPAGRTTLDETVVPADGSGFIPLGPGRGEDYVELLIRDPR